MYILNPNYVTTTKQNINKLLATRFIESIKEARWLSPTIIVPKKNGKLRICINFLKLNAATKKDPYPLLFIDEVLNIVVRYKAYSFLDGYSRYHQISIVLEDIYNNAFIIKWGAFIRKMIPFGVKPGLPTLKEYLDMFMKIFMDDFIVYSDMVSHL
jgi:hypothetical protein